MFLFISCQFFTGWHEYNNENIEHGYPPGTAVEYLTSGHFMEATFENWESEFLQMAIYVFLTVSLRQKGSAESKKLEGKEETDRPPQAHSQAPWPVKKGGMWLKLYENSLTLAFVLLFFISFTLHFVGSLAAYNQEQIQDGKMPTTASEYIGNSHFWFESFQNWQSEFLAVASIVVLSIWLRQKGSPESKPVDAPHSETGK